MSTPSSGAPDADAYAAPDSSAARLLSAALSPPSRSALTVDLVREASDAALFHLLPFVLTAAQLIGERAADRAAFVAVVATLRARLCRSRPLKTRFLLLAAHPAFAAYWRVEQHADEGDCYERDWDVSEEDLDREVQLTDFDDDDPDPEFDEIDDEDDRYNGDSDVENVAERAVPRKAVKQVAMHIPLDTVDASSNTFWCDDVHSGDADEDYSFGCGAICNPFFRADFDDVAAPIGDDAVVKKVFSSIARPTIVAIEREGDAVPPAALVKHGDNLMQDLGVQMLFVTLNAIWAADEELSQQFARPPIAVWYDVVPTDVERGLMQAVGGLQSLKDFDWAGWESSISGDDDAVDDMVRSAAGAYVATYIVGGRDRHFDNILIMDGARLLHIDFTYILGGRPPLDAPPISLAQEMEQAFTNLGVWDTFVSQCAAAFTSARRAAPKVQRAIRMSFARSGVDMKAVDTFVRSKRSLNLGVSDDEAADYVAEQVRDGARSAQTWLKRVAHDVIDPAWYGLLRNGFPPAVMIMKMLDDSENSAAQELAERLRAEAEGVSADDRVDVV